jgi:hypothetical protein
MTPITLNLPDDLAEALQQQSDRLPELLALSLQQPAVPARTYQYILEFLASSPTPEQIANFRPTPEMCERLQTLLARSKAGILTLTENQELDEFSKIEHFIIMLKSSNLTYLQSDI